MFAYYLSVHILRSVTVILVSSNDIIQSFQIFLMVLFLTRTLSRYIKSHLIDDRTTNTQDPKILLLSLMIPFIYTLYWMPTMYQVLWWKLWTEQSTQQRIDGPHAWWTYRPVARQYSTNNYANNYLTATCDKCLEGNVVCYKDTSKSPRQVAILPLKEAISFLKPGAHQNPSSTRLTASHSEAAGGGGYTKQHFLLLTWNKNSGMQNYPGKWLHPSGNRY